MKKLPVVILLGSILISAVLLHPSLVFADVGPAGIPQLEYLFARVVCLAVPAAFIVLFIILLIAGFRFLTSGGEVKALQSASQTVTWGLLGILFLGLVWLILRLIEAFTGVEVTKFSLSIFPGVPQYTVSCWNPPPLPSSPANLLPNFPGVSSKKVAKHLGVQSNSVICDNPQSTIEALRIDSTYPNNIPGDRSPNERDKMREFVSGGYLVPKIRGTEVQYPALSYETLPILSFSQKVCAELINGRCAGQYTEYIRVYRKETLRSVQNGSMKWYRLPADILREFFGNFAVSLSDEEATFLGDDTTLADYDPIIKGAMAESRWPDPNAYLAPYYPLIISCMSPETIIFKISTP